MIRLTVGIGEFKIGTEPSELLVTHALGSCLAVCIWDPAVSVGGLLHFLLPEAKINPLRASEQPAAFADTGIPLLFRAAYKNGLDKKRTRVRLVGGAETTEMENSSLNIGKRNLLAARAALWRNGVLIAGEMVGGTQPRTVHMWVGDGRLQVSSGGLIEEL